MAQPELKIHTAILEYLQLALKGAVIHHSPQEIYVSHPAARVEMKRAMAKAKYMGMLPGFPDLVVFWRGQLWGFEVKDKGQYPSEEQKAVGEAIIAQGGRWAVVRSIDDVQDRIREWTSV